MWAYVSAEGTNEFEPAIIHGMLSFEILFSWRPITNVHVCTWYHERSCTGQLEIRNHIRALQHAIVHPLKCIASETPD